LVTILSVDFHLFNLKMPRLDPPWFLGTNTELYNVMYKKDLETWKEGAIRTLAEFLCEKKDREMNEEALKGLLLLNE